MIKKTVRKSNQNNFKSKLIKKNLSTIVFLIYCIAVLLFSPDAKSFLIKQLLFTGLFNAEISSVNSADTLRNHFDFKDMKGIFKVQLT
jgi:hypothetical protein